MLGLASMGGPPRRWQRKASWLRKAKKVQRRKEEYRGRRSLLEELGPGER